MTFVERVKNTVAFYFLSRGGPFPGFRNTTLVKRCDTSKSLRSWDELVRRSELYIAEGDHRFGTFVMSSAHFVVVAGLTTAPAKPLPDDLNLLISASGDDGVILASFGATAYYMPAKIVKKFFDAFAQLNQTVIAKFGVPGSIPVPANVKLVRWLP